MVPLLAWRARAARMHHRMPEPVSCALLVPDQALVGFQHALCVRWGCAVQLQVPLRWRYAMGPGVLLVPVPVLLDWWRLLDAPHALLGPMLLSVAPFITCEFCAAGQ